MDEQFSMDAESDPTDHPTARVPRTVYLNDASRTKKSSKDNRALEFIADNHVCTAKYNVWNFLPKNLFEQFRRIANVYFLLISLLQLLTDLSPTNEYSTVGPLILIVLITMVKEGIEDKARHDADKLGTFAIAKF